MQINSAQIQQNANKLGTNSTKRK